MKCNLFQGYKGGSTYSNQYEDKVKNSTWTLENLKHIKNYNVSLGSN